MGQKGRFDDLLGIMVDRLRGTLFMSYEDAAEDKSLFHKVKTRFRGKTSGSKFSPREHLMQHIPKDYEALSLFSKQCLPQTLDLLLEILNDLIDQYRDLGEKAVGETKRFAFYKSVSTVLHVINRVTEQHSRIPYSEIPGADKAVECGEFAFITDKTTSNFVQAMSFLIDLEFLDQTQMERAIRQVSHLNFPFFLTNFISALKESSAGGKGSDSTSFSTNPYLKLIPYLDYDADKLSELLQQINLNFGVFKKDSYQQVCDLFDKAAWSWIVSYPGEYRKVLESGDNVGGNPDILFANVYQWSLDAGKKKQSLFWSSLTTLLLISPDSTMQSISNVDKVTRNPIRSFALGDLASGLTGKSNTKKERAAFCYTKMLMASSFVSRDTSKMFGVLVPESVKGPLRDTIYEMAARGGENQDDLVDFFVSSFRIDLHDMMSSALGVISSTGLDTSHHNLRQLFLMALIQFVSLERLEWNYTMENAFQYADRIRREFFMKPIIKIKELSGMLKQLGFELHDFSSKELLKKKEREIYDRDIVELESISLVLDLYIRYPEFSLASEANEDGTAKTYKEDTETLFYNLCQCLDGNFGREIEGKASKLIKILTNSRFETMWYNSTEDSEETFFDVQNVLVGELSRLCTNMDLTYKNGDLAVLLAELLHHVLRSRLELAREKDYYVHENTVKDTVKHVIQTETALLCLLPNVNTQVVSYSIQSMVELGEFVRKRFRVPSAEMFVLVNNIKHYEGMAPGKDEHTVGRAVQQARIRSQLQKVTENSRGSKYSWDVVYAQWNMRTDLLVAASKAEFEKQERTESSHSRIKIAKKATASVDLDINKELVFWENLLGFLISFKSSSDAMMTEFIGKLLGLVVMRDERIAGTATNAFAYMSPLAFSTVFNLISERIKEFVSDTEVEVSPENTFFVSKVIHIVRYFFGENASFVYLSTLNFEDLFLGISRYVAMIDSPGIKAGYAKLVVKMLENTDEILFKRETLFKNILLSEMFQWLYWFGEAGVEEQAKKTKKKKGKKSKEVVEQTPYEMPKDILEMNLAVMESLSMLLEGLILQKSTAREQDSSAQLRERSKLFHEYFALFSTVLEALTKKKKEKGTRFSVKEQRMISYTVKALSNMLNANVNIGLTQMIPMGYVEDLEIRKEFVDVFINILKQGTEFQKLEETDEDRFKTLLYMLYAGEPTQEKPTEPGFDLIDALHEVVKVTEMDTLSRSLCHLYMIPGFELDLINHLIVEEERNTPLDHPQTLFRKNTIVTRLASYYMSIIGGEYLQRTLGGPVRDLIEVVGNSFLEIEVEPYKLKKFVEQKEGTIHMTYEEILARNQQRVRDYSEVFISAVLNSLDEIPAQIFQISNFLQRQLSQRFPDYVSVSVAGFFFLRFLVPAITAPENTILRDGTKISVQARRGLVFVAKSIQKLANRTPFDSKEPFMFFMNSFVQDNIGRFDEFSDTLASTEIPIVRKENWEIDFSVDEVVENVHKFHSVVYPLIDDLSIYFKKKKKDKLYTKFVGVLQELGNPRNIRKDDSSRSGSSSFASSPDASSGGSSGAVESRLGDENKHYLSFVAKTEGYDFGALEEKYGSVFFSPENEWQAFYLATSRLDSSLEFLEFSYYVIELIKRRTNLFQKTFIVVIDGSGFLGEESLDKKWIREFRKILPNSLVSSFQEFFVLCPTSRLSIYLKKLGIKFGKNAKCYTDKREFLLATKISERRFPRLFSFPHLESGFTAFNDCRVSTPHFRSMTSSVYISEANIYVLTVRDPKYQTLDNIKIPDIIEIKKDVGPSEFVLRVLEGEDISLVTIVSDKKDAMVKMIEGYRFKLGLTKNLTQTSIAIRPGDVPGSLLNIGLLNIGSKSESLRKSAYNLLTALAVNFDYSIKNNLHEAEDGLLIPQGHSSFVVGLSTTISKQEPQITAEFLSEVCKYFQNSGMHGKFLILEYMVPWFKNLALIEDESLFDSVVDSIIDLTLTEKKLYPTILETIWVALSEETAVYTRIFERLMNKVDDDTLEKVSQIAIAFSSNNKALMSDYLIVKITALLSDIGSQAEDSSRVRTLEIYSKILLNLSFENGIVLEENLPKLFIIIVSSLTVDSYVLRKNMLSVIVNIIHSLVTNKVACGQFESYRLVRIKKEVGSLSFRLLFMGVGKMDTRKKLPKATIHNIQGVCLKLAEILDCFPAMRRWKSELLRAVVNYAFGKKNSISHVFIIFLGVLIKDPGYAKKVMDRMLKLLFTAVKSDDDDQVNSLLNSFGSLIRLDIGDDTYKAQVGWLAIVILSIGSTGSFHHSLTILYNVITTKDENLSVRQFFMSGLEANKNFDRIISVYETYTGLNFRDGFEISLAALLLQGIRDQSSRTKVIDIMRTILQIEFSLGKSQATVVWIMSLVPIISEAEILRIISESVSSDDLDVAQMKKVGDFLYGLGTKYSKRMIIMILHYLASLFYAAESDSIRMVYLAMINNSIKVNGDELYSAAGGMLLKKVKHLLGSSSNMALKRMCLRTLDFLIEKGDAVPRSKQSSTISRVGFSGLFNLVSESLEVTESRKLKIHKVVLNLLKHLGK